MKKKYEIKCALFLLTQNKGISKKNILENPQFKYPVVRDFCFFGRLGSQASTEKNFNSELLKSIKIEHV